MGHLDAIIGQDQAVGMLKKRLETGLISHAYLFVGPAGVGKQTTAQAFVRDLLAREDQAASVYLQEGMHPDLLEITIPENRTRISKEQISRDMIPWLAMRPYRAKHRVVLISDSHLLSLEAANALLKTLEEPPDYAIVIMVADQAELLETIVSRCQLVRFYPWPQTTIVSWLTSQGVSPEQAQRAAQLGQGSVGEAWRFSQENQWEARQDTALALLRDLAGGQPIKILEAASRLEEDLELMSRLVETLLRDRLIMQHTDHESMLIFAENQESYKKLPSLDPERLRMTLNRVHQLRQHARFHVNRSLIGINMAYELLHLLQNRPPVKQLQTQRR